MIMDTKTLIENSKGKRKKDVEVLLLEVLAKMLKDDVHYLDAHYIQNRTMEIIDKTIKKLKFNSKAVQDARRAFLDVLIDGAAKELYGFEDDYKLAKTNLKDKDKKKEAIEALQKITRLKDKLPRDKTEERDMNCEPTCQMIAKRIFSKEMILKDEDFINMAIEEDNGTLIEVLSRLLFEELFDQMINSIDDSYKRANAKHWGCERHEIKLSQINNRLKS
jgi:hypothetical protein